MTSGDMTRAVERLARRQDGVFSRDQVAALGFSRQMMHDRVRTGAWIRLAPQVFALASAAASWRRQYKAAEISLPGSSLGGLAACKVHRFEDFKVTRPELLVAYTRNYRTPLATVHRSDSALTTTVDGMRVTTIAQTLCDVVSRVRVDRWERAADGLLLEGRLTVEELQERRLRYEHSRRAGMPIFRALVDDRLADGYVPPASQLERALAETLDLVIDLPAAVWQAPAPWAPDNQRVDVMIPAWRLVLEADGRRWHARLADFDNDRWRDNQATALGLRVLRFTHLHLTRRRREVVELIAAAGTASAAAA
jgi:FAD/FMN-containing dehydrogenase